jgi:CRISPR-associated protein Csd2
MTTLTKKIDFAIIMSVKNANPNGDPLNGNRPRTDYEGLGEITDVCLKRKIRDRMMERYVELKKKKDGKEKRQAVFVQSDDRKYDDAKTLKARAEAELGKDLGGVETVKKACDAWIDVRAFGQLFAYKSDKKGKKKEEGESEGDTGISIGIRGPVTIQSAFSIEAVSVSSTQITKSVSGEGDGSKKGSDTMGMKHRVDGGIYVTYGSMNPQLAERTLFSDEDATVIKEILPKLFENDASSARPEGSMAVRKVIWWEHKPGKVGQYSSAKVHKTLTVNADGSYSLNNLDGLKPQEIDGF